MESCSTVVWLRRASESVGHSISHVTKKRRPHFHMDFPYYRNYYIDRFIGSGRFGKISG